MDHPQEWLDREIQPVIKPTLAVEFGLWQQGISLVAGLDEAGRGAWAGPVVAGAVILSPAADLIERLKGVRDSKLMTARQRTFWAERIRAMAWAWGVGFASCAEIDAIGIVPATRLAMERALQQLEIPPQHLLIDALRLPKVALPQTAVIKGDASILSISAASVLAKTGRDAWMARLDCDYPGYGFARHKGYGTAAHRTALESLGACAEHRLSFKPVKLWNQDHTQVESR